MNNHKATVFFVGGLCLTLLRSPAQAQMVLGQYEEEAPLGTWNIFGPSAASGLGRGAMVFGPAPDASVIFTNPAAASRLPGLTVSLGGTLQSASMFRYGPVNTGVLSSRENLFLDISALDLAALSWNFRGWTLGLGVALLEIYDRPYVEAGSAAYNSAFTFSQTGYLRAWNISLARKLFSGLSVGAGFNLVSGRWDWALEDSWNPPSRAVFITDERSREFSGYYVNLGTLWRISGKVSLAAAFRFPFDLEAESRTRLRYQAPAADTDIVIEAEGGESFRRPALAGLSLSWTVLKELSLSAGAGWWNWSSYKATSFDEELPRGFRDSWRAGLGLEYRSALRLFGQEFTVPSSLGLVYDEQPMKNPSSAYIGYTLGTGLKWKAIRLDMAAMFNFENGSGRRLVARQLALTLTVCAGRTPEEE